MLGARSHILKGWIPIRYEPAIQVTRIDVLLALIFGTFAAAYSFYCFGLLDDAIYRAANRNDIWFDANQQRRFIAMLDPGRTDGRTTVHPLYLLVASPIMRAMIKIGFEPLNAGRWIIAGCAFLTTTSLLLALRSLALPRAIAALYGAVFMVSATFTHWFSVIETYALAAVTMSFMLFVLAGVNTRNWCLWLLASVATISITVTNWMLALSSALFRMDFRRAISICAAAFALVVALSIAQKAIYPRANLFFLPNSIFAERKFILVHPKLLEARAWMPISNIWTFAVTSAVTPKPEIGVKLDARARRFVSNQYSSLTSHSTLGWVALACWLTMLVVAVLGGCANLERRAVFAAVSLFLIGQMALHAVYGEVTFLYAGNYFPALLMFVAFGWFSPYRAAATVAAAAFVVFGGVSNFLQFDAATHIVQTILLER